MSSANGDGGTASDSGEVSVDNGEATVDNGETASGGGSRTYRGRDTRAKRVLRAVAVQAATVTAAVHVLWAWPRLG
ncbi:hypothetical protein ACFQDD_12530, partial [Halorubrum pallidum]